MKERKFELASQKRISKYESFADKFLKEVFDIEGALITDESSIYDFDIDLCEEEKVIEHCTEEFLEKIKHLYNVDVSDVEGLILVDVFEKILKES